MKRLLLLLVLVAALVQVALADDNLPSITPAFDRWDLVPVPTSSGTLKYRPRIKLAAWFLKLNQSIVTTDIRNNVIGTATHTRATAGNYRDSSGNLQSASTNVPRYGWYYDTSLSAWTYGGYLGEGSVTNYALNSDAPATQTVTLSSTGQYNLWIEGSGSCTASAGTATVTLTPASGIATDGSPVGLNVTVGGTVVLTVSGSPTRFQLDSTPWKRSYVASAGTPGNKAIDYLTYAFPVPQATFDSAGTFYLEFSPEPLTANPAGSAQFCFFITDQAGANQMLAYSIGTTGIYALRSYDGTSTVSVNIPTPTQKTYKFVVTWGAAGRTIYNLTDGMDTYKVTGSYDGGWNATSLQTGSTTRPPHGWIKAIRYYTYQMTDDEVRGIQ